MAFVIKNRVQETTVTTGTGTITLLGATQAHQSFSAIGNGNTTCYQILSSDGVNWEVGIGTYTSAGTTLSRTTILESSNSGSAIVLVNTSLVSCTNPAQQAPTNGLFDQLFGTTNGFVPTRTGGVWIGATPGGGGGPALYSTVPMTAAPTSAGTGFTTWRNQGTASVADTLAGLTISDVSSGFNIRARTKAVPATPYTYTALVAISGYVNNNYCGLCWTDGTKFHTFGLDESGGSWILFVCKANTASSFNANDTTSGTGAPPFIWLQMTDDGTNVIFKYSTDGVNFMTLQSTAKAAAFLGTSGYTNVGFFINPQGGDMKGTLMSLAQT